MHFTKPVAIFIAGEFAPSMVDALMVVTFPWIPTQMPLSGCLHAGEGAGRACMDDLVVDQWALIMAPAGPPQQTTSRVGVPIALQQWWLSDSVRHVLWPKVADPAIEADQWTSESESSSNLDFVF